MNEPSAPAEQGVTWRDFGIMTAVVLATGAMFVALGMAASSMVAPDSWSTSARLAVAVGPLLVLCPVVALWLVPFWLSSRRGWGMRDIGMTLPNRVPVGLVLWVPLAIVTAALATGAALQAQRLLGSSSPNESSEPSAASGLVADLPVSAALLMALGSIVLFPVLEEVYFRGLLLNVLRRHMPRWSALLIGALVFSVVHLIPMVMPYTLVLGLWLGWLRFRYASMLPGMVLHSANNALVATAAVGLV